MPSASCRRFCRAVDQECGGQMLRSIRRNCLDRIVVFGWPLASNP
jgi:hypothetical protein